MFSQATMRLVGLLVIVGVVAGCGGAAERPAQLRADAAELEREGWRLGHEILSVIHDAGPDAMLTDPATEAYESCLKGLDETAEGSCGIEEALDRGDMEAALDMRRRALRGLDAVRQHLEPLRMALSAE